MTAEFGDQAESSKQPESTTSVFDQLLTRARDRFFAQTTTTDPGEPFNDYLTMSAAHDTILELGLDIPDIFVHLVKSTTTLPGDNWAFQGADGYASYEEFLLSASISILSQELFNRFPDVAEEENRRVAISQIEGLE